MFSIEISGVTESGAYRKPVTPKISVSDNDAKVETVLDGKPYDNDEISSDGSHTLEVVAVDSKGNRHRRNLSFVIDRSSPTTTASVSGPKHASPKIIFLAKTSAIELSSQDTGDGISGVAKTEYHFGETNDWKTYDAPIGMNLLGNGQHTIHFRAIDKAGNIEPDNDLTFYIDSSAPSSSIDIGTPQYKSAEGKLYLSGSTGFAISTTDNESGVGQIEYRIDKGDWQTYRETFRVEDEGEHRIEYRSSDNVGNLEEIRHISAYVDTSPPISIISPLGNLTDTSGIYYTNRPVRISMEVTDRLSGVAKSEYRIDQGPWQTYAPFDIDDKKSHAVSFRSSDNVNNQEIIKVLEIGIDKTPPVTSLSIGSPNFNSAKGLRIVSNSTFFTITATDTQSGVGGMEYRVDDDAGWLPYEPFTIQEGGNHVVSYRSTDKAGNREVAQSMSVFVDVAPPSSEIKINNKPLDSGSTLFSRKPVEVKLSSSDKGADTKLIEYKLDSGPWTTYQPFSISAEGAHLLEFRSTDIFDNVEPTRFVNVVIDNTPPVTALIIGEPKEIDQGVLKISDKTVLALSSVDELSGPPSSEYLIIGKGERQGNEPFSISTEGEYEIIYQGVDKAGNLESKKSSRIKVVIPPPLPPMTATPEDGRKGDKQGNLSTSSQDQDIPESIRIPKSSPPEIQQDAKPVKTKPPSSPIQNADDESLYLTGFDQQPFSNKDMPGKSHFKEYMGMGGINAFIITLIFLVL